MFRFRQKRTKAKISEIIEGFTGGDTIYEIAKKTGISIPTVRSVITTEVIEKENKEYKPINTIQGPRDVSKLKAFLNNLV